MKTLEEIRSYHEDRENFLIDHETNAFIDRYYSEYLKVIMECFPYILKTQLCKMFGKSHGVNRERVRRLIERDILGEETYRGTHYLYPMKKAVAWYLERPDVATMNPTPSEMYLLDCFTRAEAFIAYNPLVHPKPDVLDKYILVPNKRRVLLEFEQQLEDVKRNQPLAYHKKEVLAFKDLIQTTLVTESDLQESKKLFGSSTKLLEKIQFRIVRQQKLLDQSFISMIKSIFEVGYQTKEWETKKATLEALVNSYYDDLYSLPVTLNKYAVFRLQGIKQDKRNKQNLLSHMPSETKDDQLSVVREALHQLSRRHCYLIELKLDGNQDLESDERQGEDRDHVLFRFLIIGHIDSTHQRYFRAFEFFQHIAECLGKQHTVHVHISADSEKAKPVIEKTAHRALKQFEKKYLFSRIKKLAITVIPIERYYRNNGDGFDIDEEKIQQAAKTI